MAGPVLKGDHVRASPDIDGFLRHIQACQSANLPGERVAFRIGAAQVGWVAPAVAAALAARPEVRRAADGLRLSRGELLEPIGQELAAAGLFRLRREAFDIRAYAGGPVLGRLDRGGLPKFGAISTGVHVNGLVRRADGLHVWVGRRAADKALDPNKLDHLVAGGIPAGLTAAETLVKEAGEEAAIPPALARRARRVATLRYTMERPEGLRRDVLYCYDLELPEDFVPFPNDGEAQGFELWPVAEVMAEVRAGDAFKFNVNLVLIDLFLRVGLIQGSGAEVLRAALEAG